MTPILERFEFEGNPNGVRLNNAKACWIDLKCKVVDFGNASWARGPIAEEIQTRQYRAPEVIILKSGYSFPDETWSFACIAIELATGEMMFAPTGGQGFSEDEDHLALMMELLGKMPRKIARSGGRSKVYFDRYGDLKRIRRLKYLSLHRLLLVKYRLSVTYACQFAGFLCPILDCGQRSDQLLNNVYDTHGII
ncbi:hypothetical protein Pfo_018962 [Paulownia fortunei]|nr:hypothetical protein Pfo_018962 [Paulownia fortunei]